MVCSGQANAEHLSPVLPHRETDCMKKGQGAKKEKADQNHVEIGRKLEIALREISATKNLLSNIVDGNPIPTFIMNKDHEVVYWNQTLEKISGIKAGEVIGTTDAWRAFYDTPRPVMADLIIDGADEQAFWRHYKDNTLYTTLQKSPLKEGAYESQDFFPKFGEDGMWLLAHACPLTGDDGKVIGAIETFQNVTKLIETQKESNRNEKKYRSLFENAGDAFLLMVNDRLIDCNAMSLKLFNCSHEDILGNSISVFFPEHQPAGPESTTVFQEKIVKAYEGKPQRFYWRFSGFFAREFDANVTLSRVEVLDRYVLQVVIRDISEHVKAEKELASLRNYLSDIINSMPSILIGINKNGVITQWNTMAEQQTGVTSRDAVGKRIWVVFPRIKNRMNEIKQAMEAGKTFEVSKIPYERHTGVCYENLTVYPLSGKTDQGAVIRIDDVTDQVRMEEMMIQTEKMNSVGSLAAGLAHEINNPLAGMMQNSQVLMNRLTGKIPANIKAAEKFGVDLDRFGAYLEEREILKLAMMINDSGKRAAKIIRNVLSFSRKSETGKRMNHLPTIIENTIEIASTDYDLKTDYDFKQIEIVKEYEKDVPPVFCDESKIQQVFWNILKNGAEAMQSSREPSRFIIRVGDLEQYVCVEIEDNGPGMDSLTRNRLFEPFFTTKGQGTGLGLSVSYFIIVKDHGGKIKIESEKGAGSKFVILLKK